VKPRKRANENITLAGTSRDNSVPGSSSQVNSLFEEFSDLNLGTDDCSSPRCSRKCGRCGLCGNNGTLENMVWETNHVYTLNGSKVKLKEHLTCSDYGIYVAMCRECDETYTGQTKRSFTQRWSEHRITWNTVMRSRRGHDRKKATTKSNFHKGNQGLFVHYKKFHDDRLLSGSFELSSAYKVVFLEKPGQDDLDNRKDYWIRKLQSSINIAKTYLTAPDEW